MFNITILTIKGGANEESLNEARKNYQEFGASAKKYINEVRDPLPDEIPL